MSDEKENGIEELQAQFELAKELFWTAREFLGSAAQKLAERRCPYEVGDKVPSRAVFHSDKPCMITKIGSTFEGDWIVRAKLLKKDGTPSRREVFWQASNELLSSSVFDERLAKELDLPLSRQMRR